MAYTKTTWVEGSAPGISAANLNKLETQYDEVKTELGINGGDIPVDARNIINDGAGSGLDADLIKGKDGVWEPQFSEGKVDSQFTSPSTNPRGLAWDGTNLWNADTDTDKIYKLNTSGTILNQFTSPSSNPTGLAWDGTNLWNDIQTEHIRYHSQPIYKSFDLSNWTCLGRYKPLEC